MRNGTAMDGHEIKACIVKYNTLRSNGTVILPEALKDCEGSKIPIVSNFYNTNNPESVIGYAVLHCTDDGVECTGMLSGNKTVNETD